MKIEQMADIAAPIRAFVRDLMMLDPNRSVGLDAAYTEYKLWCEAGKHKPMSATRFGPTIHDTFPSVKVCKRGSRGNQRTKLEGIALRSANDNEEPKVVGASGDDDIMRARKVA